VTPIASAAPHALRRLLWPHSYIPLPAGGVGIDRNNAVFVGKLVKAREAFHVLGILILTGQKNDHRIVLLLVVTLGQMNCEGAGDIIDVEFFLRILRAQRSHAQQTTQAGGEHVLLLRPEPSAQFHSCGFGLHS
jgi:hypothetical protein